MIELCFPWCRWMSRPSVSLAGCAGVTVETGAGSPRVTLRNVLPHPLLRQPLLHLEKRHVHHHHWIQGNTGRKKGWDSLRLKGVFYWYFISPTVMIFMPSASLLQSPWVLYVCRCTVRLFLFLCWLLPWWFVSSVLPRVPDGEVAVDSTVPAQSDPSQVRKKAWLMFTFKLQACCELVLTFLKENLLLMNR